MMEESLVDLSGHWMAEYSVGNWVDTWVVLMVAS